MGRLWDLSDTSARAGVSASAWELLKHSGERGHCPCNDMLKVNGGSINANEEIKEKVGEKRYCRALI